jgi:RNA polymerase sigma-70 factor (ECF subfamily)
MADPAATTRSFSSDARRKRCSMAKWLAQLLSGSPGFENEVVERYTQDLIELARRQLPQRLRGRLDPEDVVQSVYYSFFRRLNDGRFKFDDSHDVWRLLAAMTFHKAQNAVKHHQQQKRDVRRDHALAGHEPADRKGSRKPLESTGAADVGHLFECLENLLTALPEQYRQIVIRRLEGDSIESIARQVQRSRRTVLRVLAHLQDLASQQLEALP